MSRWASLALLLLACGQPATATQTPRAPDGSGVAADASVAATPTLADDLPRLAQRARQLYLDWAAAFADPNLDCAAATERLTALADKNADVTAANQQVLRAGHARVKAFRAELDKYAAEIDPAAKSIMESPIMARCSKEPAFSGAVDRLQGQG